jgi:hypothetical protein
VTTSFPEEALKLWIRICTSQRDITLKDMKLRMVKTENVREEKAADFILDIFSDI